MPEPFPRVPHRANRFLWLAAAVLGACRLAWPAAPAGPALELPQQARIAVAGDGLAVGLEETGYFELMLRGAFPGAALEVRHFGVRGATARDPWPGLDAARCEAALARFDPHLVVVCLSRNDAEPGGGDPADFERAFSAILDRWGTGQRLVLAPILFPESPGWIHRQRRSEAMRAVCECKRAVFCDLAAELAGLRMDAGSALTWNGVDLNPYGHWLLAMLTAREMGWCWAAAEPAGTGWWEDWEKLRSLVLARNRRWRASWPDEPGAPLPGTEEAAIRAFPVPGLEALWSVEPFAHDRLARSAPAPAGVSPAGPLPELALAPGYSAAVWARADELPFGGAERMDFDAQGRLYLLCRGGRVVRLEDPDRDHAADCHRAFAEFDGRLTGLAAAPEGLWVAVDGELWRLNDEDGDGRAEGRDRMLGRFDVSGTAGIRNLTWGAFGELWFSVEQAGPSRLETGGGALETVPGCGLFRLAPGRGDLARVADWAAGGEALLSFDSSDALWLTAPGNGATWSAEQAAWFSGQPAGAPLAQTGAPVSAVVCWRCGEPESSGVLDCLVLAEPGARGALRWFRRTGGAVPGWAEAIPGCLAGHAAGFSPVALAVGPDGALYVLDRGGGLPGGERIWRIAPSGGGERWAAPTLERPVPELLGALGGAETQQRRRIRQELWRRAPSEVNAALAPAAPDGEEEEPVLESDPAEVLGLRLAQGIADEALLRQAVSAGPPRSRVAAARACGEWFSLLPGAGKLLAALLDDEVGEVRLAALASARRVGGPALAALARLAGDHPQPGYLEPVCRATLTALGPGPVATTEPASLAAQAAAQDTAALAGGDLTPQAAAELWRRPDSPLPGLHRAASLLAARRGTSLTEFLLGTLEDRWSPEQELRNARSLLVSANLRELHQAVPRLRGIAAGRGAKPEARGGADAALVLSAASGGSLELLVGESHAGQARDAEVTGWLEAAAHVASHPAARDALREWVKRELGGPGLAESSTSGQVRREAALALAAVLEAAAPKPASAPARRRRR